MRLVTGVVSWYGDVACAVGTRWRGVWSWFRLLVSAQPVVSQAACRLYLHLQDLSGFSKMNCFCYRTCFWSRKNNEFFLWRHHMAWPHMTRFAREGGHVIYIGHGKVIIRPCTATKSLLETQTRNSNTWLRGFPGATRVTGVTYVIWHNMNNMSLFRYLKWTLVGHHAARKANAEKKLILLKSRLSLPENPEVTC